MRYLLLINSKCIVFKVVLVQETFSWVYLHEGHSDCSSGRKRQTRSFQALGTGLSRRTPLVKPWPQPRSPARSLAHPGLLLLHSSLLLSSWGFCALWGRAHLLSMRVGCFAGRTSCISSAFLSLPTSTAARAFSVWGSRALSSLQLLCLFRPP